MSGINWLEIISIKLFKSFTQKIVLRCILQMCLFCVAPFKVFIGFSHFQQRSVSHIKKQIMQQIPSAKILDVANF
jgi:hypothetical protein